MEKQVSIKNVKYEEVLGPSWIEVYLDFLNPIDREGSSGLIHVLTSYFCFICFWDFVFTRQIQKWFQRIPLPLPYMFWRNFI